jgi:hypothetical protein
MPSRMMANLRKQDDGNRSPRKVMVRMIPGKRKVIKVKRMIILLMIVLSLQIDASQGR